MLMDWAIEPSHVEKVKKIWNKATLEQRVKFLIDNNVSDEYLIYAKKKWDKLPELIQGVCLTKVKPIF